MDSVRFDDYKEPGRGGAFWGFLLFLACCFLGWYVWKLDKRVRGLDLVSPLQIAEVDVKIENLKKNVIDRASLDGYAMRITALEEFNRLHKGQDTSFLNVALVMERRIERGEPFAGELVALATVAPPSAMAMVDSLKPYAETGVKSAAALAVEFDEMVDKVAYLASNQTVSEGFFGRIWLGLKEIVKVRRVDVAAGDTDADAAAERTLVLLQNGDIAGAKVAFEPIAPYAPQFAADLFASYTVGRASDGIVKLAIDRVVR